MSALDLAPAPGAAPRPARVLSHGRTELGLLLRNGEQLLLALVVPVLILVGGRLAGTRVGLDASTLTPSVLGLALWSTSFTSLAIATGFDRRYGVLERLAATPIGTGGVLAGKALATLAVCAGQVVVLAALGMALGWRPAPSPLQSLIVVLAAPLAVVSFAALALCLAGRLRAEVTLALANLIYLLLLMGGGLLWPVAVYPAALRPLIAALPTAALGETLRAWSTGVVLWWPALVLAGWALVLTLLARRLFRWTS